MCGRYQRRSDKQKTAEAFALGNIDGLALELAPDYNVAPQTMHPVVVSLLFGPLLYGRSSRPVTTANPA